MATVSYAAEIAAAHRESPEYHDAPPACACGAELHEDDEDGPCHECWCQGFDEAILRDAAENALADLADALSDYQGSRRADRETSRGKRAELLVRAAVRLLKRAADVTVHTPNDNPTPASAHGKSA